jgi:hypothetical protein
MDLARSLVNDMYPGVGGTNGRILTNSAPFTINYINSAQRTIARKLRIEGVTFPIKDGVILNNLTPVPNPSVDIQTFVGFEGYFDGVTLHATPQLPPDCLQVFVVSEQTAGSGLPYSQMVQPENGLPSSIQTQVLGMWEWRQYRIYMIGSTATKNLRIRYQSGVVPFNTPPADFDTAYLGILDCEEAVAAEIARLYALARGGGNVQMVTQMRDDAIDDMVNEWTRRQQQQNFRRESYEGGGSQNEQGTPLGPVDGWGT